MKAKEKAKEIFENCYKLAHDGSDCNSFTLKIQKENAKQLSLYFASEIIKSLRKDLALTPFGKGYWYSVKKEIEKLTI